MYHPVHAKSSLFSPKVTGFYMELSLRCIVLLVLLLLCFESFITLICYRQVLSEEYISFVLLWGCSPILTHLSNKYTQSVCLKALWNISVVLMYSLFIFTFKINTHSVWIKNTLGKKLKYEKLYVKFRMFISMFSLIFCAAYQFSGDFLTSSKAEQRQR